MNVGHEPSRSTPDADSGADADNGMRPTDVSANSFGAIAGSQPAGLVGAASHAGITGNDAAELKTSASSTGVSADTSPDGMPQPLGAQPLGASVEASTKLIETFQAGVWRYLRAMGCDAALAEDLTQETFVAILQRPFVDHGAMATAAYLRRVAHNLYVTFRRRNGRMTTTDDVEEISHAWDRWAGQDQGEELIEILNDCLSRLTDRARKALEMRFRGEHSRNEIAEFLTITEHGAKNLMQRAKHQLRECIERKLNRP